MSTLPSVDLGLMAEHLSTHEGMINKLKVYHINTTNPDSIPTISGLEEVNYLTSTTLLELKKMPKRLTVIGSGYIGLELGQLFHNLGSEVTLIQRSERLLKEYDPEISEAVEKVLT